MLETNIHIQTQNFDGPLGLLLHLIQRDEMDIKDLDLNKMTQQYLNYLVDMKELNFDIAGDYLYMASTLLFLKSKKHTSQAEGSELDCLSPSNSPESNSFQKPYLELMPHSARTSGSSSKVM